MNNSFASLVESSASVLVVLPTKPTFDQVAAGMALYMSIDGLETANKQVSIMCSNPMTVGFNRIIGVNKISQEAGNKNLTIKFKSYDANNIEKVSYDIVNGEFNLTIVPKVGFVSPQKDQLGLEYSGVAADLVVLVGGANDSHFPALSSQEFTGAKFAHIGTRTLSASREIMSFARAGSSVSELVANLIKDANFDMDPDIATNLLMGIEDGSSNFASNEVTPETFETFAYLLRSGGQRQPKTKLSPMGFPPGAIPTQPFSKPVQPQAVQEMEPPKNPQPVKPIAEQIEDKEQIVEGAPDDWLQPKVFKGTSVS